MKSESSFWKEVERRQAAGEQLDVHTFRVSYFDDIPMDKVTGEQRAEAKRLNYVNVYGIKTTFAELFGKELK